MYNVQYVVVRVKVLQVPYVKYVVNFVCIILRKLTRIFFILDYRLTFQSFLGYLAAIIFWENFHFNRLSSDTLNCHSFYTSLHSFYALMYTDSFLRNDFILRFTNIWKVKLPSRENLWASPPHFFYLLTIILLGSETE